MDCKALKNIQKECEPDMTLAGIAIVNCVQLSK